jgi:hypothetical protein
MIGAITFALYLRTLAPDMLSGDTGEFQFAAWRLGLAHPTGYPLYLMLGWLWQHAFALFGVSPAWSLNAMSALAAAVGAALLYLCVAQWTPPPSARRRMAALYSSIWLVGNLTYWSQALIAEVYALHVVLMLALLLAMQRLVAMPTVARLLVFALLAGLSLAHHALTLLWLPALLLYWLLANRNWRQIPLSGWLLALAVGALPLLLYAYIPLRAGPEASPWYHQRLGDGTLELYSGGWNAFWTFISGQSIDARFRTVGEAWAQLSQAAWLWHYHFGWVGLAIAAAGIFWLARARRYAVLVPTLLYVVAQQIFNLFYDIGDILVYYIPLYVVGSLWAGFGLAGLLGGDWRLGQTTTPKRKGAAQSNPMSMAGWLLGAALILLALRILPTTSAQINQSTATEARQQWEPILVATPAPDAILVSNDRNEIVPLFYLQAVEGRGTSFTGLFPGIAPEPRFADIGATLETALVEGGDQPVFLIKQMPGLEVRFDLRPTMPPLVEVLGTVSAAPTVRVDQPYGPLQLLGYDLTVGDKSADLALHWHVNAPVSEKYVATAQLLTTGDRKITQDDYAPGGDYYPTSLWKEGEQLVVRHTLPLAEPLPETVRLLVGFYRADDQSLLAQPLTLDLR